MGGRDAGRNSNDPKAAHLHRCRPGDGYRGRTPSWQLRLALAPAVDAYVDSGRDESDFVDLDDILGARP
ncbi:hypothetical protein OG599_00190 [Streptomyces sp. NBC_01335]|uniref:hypothetical protein n=1 Tax=Streptomyces sp. NBC_01335 TaxID=2903828 RepID=UPI002E0DFD06|nr:hypothetical protein OG599_00190 [Streptomyces sp. NBC_01335]